MKNVSGVLAVLLALCFIATALGTSGCKRSKTPDVGTSLYPPLPPSEEDLYPVITDDFWDPGIVETASIPTPPREPADTQVPELRTVYFAFDSSELSPQTQDILSDNVRYLQMYPDLMIQVQGHCDERGTREYNMALGERRAESVRQYLINQGVDAARLHPVSYGEEYPVAPGSTEAAYEQNRRVQFMSY